MLIFLEGVKMREKRIKKEDQVPEGQYRAWYRCANCGVIFQFDMQLGKPASEMSGSCPTCGVKSGAPKIGVFPIVKFNPEQDAFQRHYFR